MSAVCGRGSARGQILYPDAVAGAQPEPCIFHLGSSNPASSILPTASRRESWRNLVRRLYLSCWLPQHGRESSRALSAATAAPAARARRRRCDLNRAAPGGAPLLGAHRGRGFFSLRPQHFLFFTVLRAAATIPSYVTGAFFSREPSPCPLGPATTHHPGTACTHSYDPSARVLLAAHAMPRGPRPGSSKLPGGCERDASRGWQVQPRSGG